MFKEEKGRLEIINFLVTNKLTFSFNYNKDEKTMDTNFTINGECISTLKTPNDGSYLKEYGFKNIAEEFKTLD